MHEKNRTIHIGLNPWPGYEFFYLAKQKGFYKELGLNIEIEQYNSLEDVRYAFEKGQIDIMNSTIIELLLAQQRTNKKPQAFFVTDFSNGGDVILANKNIKNIKDLKNKKIGVEPQSLGLYVIARALQMAGIKEDEITILGLIQLEMEEALKNKEVDAVVTYPPIAINITKNIPNINNIFSSADIPGEIVDVVSASEEFIIKNSEELLLILKAWDMAVDYSIENPEDAYTIMANRENITKEEFESVISDMEILKLKDQKHYLQPKGSVERALWLSIEVFKNLDYIKGDLNPKSLVNMAPVNLFENEK